MRSAIILEPGNITPKRRGRPRSAQQRLVAADILDAAKRCLGAKGSSEVSMHDIAHAAGTTTAMIRYYYGSQENLLNHIVNEAIDNLVTDFKALIPKMLDDPGRATSMLVHLIDNHCRSHAAASKTLLTELIRGQSSVAESYVQRWSLATHRGMAQILASLIEAGICRPDADAQEFMFLVKSLIFFPAVTPQISERFPLRTLPRKHLLELVASTLNGYLYRHAPEGTQQPVGFPRSS